MCAGVKPSVEPFNATEKSVVEAKPRFKLYKKKNANHK
jgi:hypothetical protein